MEAFATALRWLLGTGGLVLLGGLALMSLAGGERTQGLARWRRGLMAAAPWLTGAVLLAHTALLGWQLVSVTDRAETLLQWREWERLLADTRYGLVWQCRQALALAMMLMLLGAGRTGRQPPGAWRGSEPPGTGAQPPRPPGSGWHDGLLAPLLALALTFNAAGVLAGHTAATEPLWLTGLSQLLHTLAAGFWAGGLPALLYALWLARHPVPGESLALQRAFRQSLAVLLRRFSALAAASVVLLVLTGTVTAYLQSGAPRYWPTRADDLLGGLTTLLERSVAPLLGSDYGQLVLAKVLLLIPVLLIAARVRWVWMPRMGPGAGTASAVAELARPSSAEPHGTPLLTAAAVWPAAASPASPAAVSPAAAEAGPWRSMTRWLGVELGLVLLILLLAARLTETLPAAHDQWVWPLPFRWSLAASWELPGVAVTVRLAALIALGATAVLLHALWRLSRRPYEAAPPMGQAGAPSPALESGLRRRMVLAGLVAVTGLVTGLAMVSVEAYPDTYRRTDTGYTAVSVAQGAALFQQHCTRCHGEGGRGDGPAATGLPRKAANLTEPHTALHTAGDIFWWLSHGRPEGGMPGFSEVLSVEQRWDLVNFLRAFSAGHQARILTAAVAPGQPWLGPPDFDYDTTAGQPGSLSGQRGQGSVLLVFYAPQGSAARLQQLAQAYPQLRERHAEVLAVPWPQALGADSGLAMVAGVPGRQPAASAEPPEFSASQPSTSTSGPLPFPVVTDGSLEAATAYRLFRRTLADAGRTVLDAPPPHMEFLIDRFGYLRARWLPQAGESGGTGGGWGEMAALLRQIELLEREPPIRPPPDDHVH